LHQVLHHLTIETAGQSLIEITDQARDFVAGQNIRTGLLTLFCRHTSASLLIQENADLHVRRDLEAFFKRLAPEEEGLYVHAEEGADDMPAHIRTALTSVHLSIPVAAKHMLLGTWQGIYLFEHRRRPHRREIVLHLFGE
jgi:secondary thiamine-phosphate synthase enzyme